MRFKRVILINPHYPGSHYKGEKSSCPPVGLGVIGEMLGACGIHYEVIDFSLGYNADYLKTRIDAFMPDAIGISMMTFRYEQTYLMLNEIKEMYPRLRIIAGGPHVTAWRLKVLEQCPAIDFGICSEGEYSVVELCAGSMPLTAIKGLVYRNGGQVLFTGERDLIHDLDSIPFPKYAKFELNKYQKIVQINSSRGCPYKCIFCQSCSVLGKQWRSRSASNIVDEIRFWLDKGYVNFTFVADNFTMNKNLIYQLCDLLEEQKLTGINFSAPGVRVDLVDYALLKRMRGVGFNHIAFGIEAGNNKVLAALKKGFTIEQAEESVGNAIKLGFAVKLYFLVGSPYETLSDVRESINFALKFPVSGVNFGSLMPIPNTELMEWVIAEGRLLSPPEVYLNRYAEFERIPHFDAPGMSLNERKRALLITSRAIKKIRQRVSEVEFRQKFAHLGIFGNILAKILRFEVVTALLDTKLIIPLKEFVRAIVYK